MSEHFFVLMYATSGNERSITRFQSYRSLEEAISVIHEWLEKTCAMDLVPAAREAEVRAENGGELPESAFVVPEVREPKDLVKYNGFYDYESLGVFNLFLTPVYDRDTAERFKNGMNKEFGIDQEWSDRADRMMEQLKVFVSSFDDPGVDFAEAEEAMRTSLCRGASASLTAWGRRLPTPSSCRRTPPTSSTRPMMSAACSEDNCIRPRTSPAEGRGRFIFGKDRQEKTGKNGKSTLNTKISAFFSCFSRVSL